MNGYFSIVTLIIAFFIGVLTYRQGFKDGLNVKSNKPMEDIKNPVTEAINTVQSIKQSKEDREKNKELEEELIELFSYNGDIKGGE